jgi:Domain of unknown function (DUF4372)
LADQYLAVAFAHLTYRESLRDIETCLGDESSAALTAHEPSFHPQVPGEQRCREYA